MSTILASLTFALPGAETGLHLEAIAQQRVAESGCDVDGPPLAGLGYRLAR